MFEQMKVKDIKDFITTINHSEYMKYISILKEDKRKSVKDIATKLAKELDKIRIEDERLERMLEFERELYQNGYELIGGIDEAGRGPLAGPVVSSVVILKKDDKIRFVNDSKKLSEKKREELYDIIMDRAISVGIGIVDNKRIDEINILNATYESMLNAIDSMSIKPDALLIDAVRLPKTKLFQKSIFQGDEKSLSIAAASIIAKVTRDRIMKEYHEKYEEYNFLSHKGYGTKYHYDAIKEHGITDIHRLSFLKNL